MAVTNPLEGLKEETPAAKALRGMNPATDRQKEYLKDLIYKVRNYDANVPPVTDEWLAKLTKPEAGRLIAKAKETLQALRDKAAKETVPASPAGSHPLEGIHILDGDVYKVQIAFHGSGHPYAKKLQIVPGNKAKWNYEPGALSRLTPDTTKMTLEDAQVYGRLYGICCVCGRTLTNEESIEAGIGPVCKKRL